MRHLVNFMDSRFKVSYTDSKEPGILDVAPYFLPTVLFIASVLWYQVSPSGNGWLGPWAVYVGTPLYNYFIMQDTQNLRKENERKFANSSMFLLPLYSIVIVNFFAWIHGMMLFSDMYGDFKESNFMFRNRPKSYWDDVSFFIGLNFFSALASISGHELIHRKATIHKLAGSLPYCQYFYTHFWTEHIHTHHRELGTPNDAVSHELGTSVYAAIINAWVGTHKSVWSKEIRRITR